MVFSKCAGASVLCYSWSATGHLKLLLGQDVDGKKWSDFGGGLLHWHESDIQCAYRELLEETHGLVKVVLHNSTPHVKFQFHDIKNRLRHYTTFLVEVPFQTELPSKFKVERLRVRCDDLSLKVREARLEKIGVDYVGREATQTTPYRYFFGSRLKLMKPYLDQIEQAIQEGTPILYTGLLQTFNIDTP